jgi:hypothetical protein
LATDFQEADISESLYALEKDLDSLLQLGGPEATACRGASGCSCASDLMITSTPEGRFIHWRGMKLSDLLEAEDQLVAHLEPLPFQEGRPLATLAEESTELVDASSDELVSRQVLMAEEGENDADFPIFEFDAISEDEATANTGDENDADREARRARNRARTIRRRRVNERRRSMHRKLDPEFAAVSERGFRTRWPTSPGLWPYSSAVMILMCAKHFFTRRGPGSSWISKTRRPLSGRSAWARVGARLTAERLAVVLDLSPAITTTTLVGAWPLAGGSNQLQGVTRDRPIVDLLQKPCASTLMKAVMRGP